MHLEPEEFEPPQDPLQPAKVALGGLAVAAFAALALVSLGRVAYPFGLEWIESGTLQQVRRVAAGQPIYVEPTLDYVPFIYTPLYFHVSGWVARAVGVGFDAPRWVSLLSTLGLLTLLYHWTRAETGSRWAGLLSAGLFAASFRAGGAWFDVARVDMLFLLLALAGLYTLRFVYGVRGLLLGGGWLGLAFLTKQQALILSLPLIAWALWRYRWRGLTLPATLAAIVIGTTLLFDAQTQGWYSFFVFSVPARHENEWPRAGEFWSRDILGNFHVAILMSVWLLAFGQRPHDAAARAAPPGYYGVVLLAALLTSWISRIHWGGYDNTLLPGIAALSLLAGIAAHRADMRLAELPTAARRGRALLYAGVAAQYLVLAYNPLAQLPTPADEAAGWSLVQRIRDTPGDVFVPRHPYLPARADKPEFMHWMAYWDVVRCVDLPAAQRLLNETRAALQQKRFAAVVVDGLFRPVTGYRTRPEFWCEAR
jgi:Dolichyl-phosphate-mannose-protein mannosyltransferase